MTCVYHEVRHKESAADEAGDPHAPEHNKIASGTENAGMPPSLPPLPSPSKLSSSAI